jgi:putative hydrolase of the HAD superfamily
MDKILSFDMDGTLINQSFADAVWLKGIPTLYAKKKGIRFQEAKKYILEEYEKIGSGSTKWYDIHYWLKKLNLDYNWKTLLNNYRSKVTLYPEVPEVLDTLRRKYLLIIISNAAREFLNIELETTGLRHYFCHIFSAVTDFKQTKKQINVYQQICDTLSIESRCMIHVGDDYCFDYLTPRKLGITAFYLNRNHNYHTDNRQYTISNLRELIAKI